MSPDDIGYQSQSTSVPPIPPICDICEIPIYAGFDHSGPVIGHFVALKAFTKLCQDQIEKDRIEGFEHPTRQELLEGLGTLLQLFQATNEQLRVLTRYIQNIMHGTIPYAHQQAQDIEYTRRRGGHHYPEESAHNARALEHLDTLGVDTRAIRELLQTDVSDTAQGMVQDYPHGSNSEGDPRP